MRGTEGYTGRYVWKLSVLFNLGRKRRGAAAPCIHWEDPVLNMASGVCKAYIRGALVSDWFWNKFSQALWASQAKVVLAVNGSLCLTSSRSFRIHLESSWSLTTSGRAFMSEREQTPQHSHVQNALRLKQSHPSACRHVLVEDLASICTKNLCPSPFTPSWYTCLIVPVGAFGIECASTWNEWSWCTSASKEGHCFSWGQ